MNNYESFRDELVLELSRALQDYSNEVMTKVLTSVDCVAKTYNIEKQTTELAIVEDGIPILVKWFIASKKVEQKSEGTLRNYTLVLKNFLYATKKDVKDITPNDIRVYFHYYQETRGVKGNTIEMMRHVLNSFFYWCFTEGHIDKDPTRNIKAIKTDIKEREYLEPVELEYIREACQNEREKAVIDFLFSTGCRVSEMCNVLLSEVNWDNCTVYISNGKGGKARTTFLNAESVVSLKAYLKQRKDNNPYLFTYDRIKNEQRLNKRAIEILIHKIVKRCPQITKKVTPHIMRHTAATVALRNGMPLEQVKEFLGHSNLNTTMIYAKVNKDDIKRSHEKYLR